MGTAKVSGGRVVASILGVAVAAFAVDAVAVDEIIVTTRKREENLQQVPIAVEAITAEDLERKGIVNLKGLVEQSSSLILDQVFAPQDQRITVRGLSPTRGRQNVAVLQDGIDISSEAIGTAGGSLLINPRLFDLERVEIVKGPQNALYGRSAFAGAINYITRKPSDVVDVRVGTDIGSDGQFEVSGNLSGPLAEGLAAGITGMTWSHNGFYDNQFTGEEMGDTEGNSVAGTLVWEASEALSVTARVETLNDEFGVTPYSVAKYSGAPDPTRPQFNTTFTVPAEARVDPDGAGPQVAPTTALTVLGVSGDIPDGDDLVAQMSEDPRTCDPGTPASSQGGCRNYPGTDREVNRGTLTLEWDVSDLTFTSLSHYADARTNQIEGAEDVSASIADPNFDFVPFPPPGASVQRTNAVGEVRFETDTKLFSQEFRVQSADESRFNWTAGALYWGEDTDQRDGSFTCIQPGGTPCSISMAAIGNTVPLNADRWFRNTDHYSIYGLVDWEFIESWRVILEARQTWEDSEVGGPSLDNGIYSPIAAFGQGINVLGPGTDANGVTAVAGVNSGKEDDDFFAPKGTLEWRAAENQMYYLSVAEAFKPKGISALNVGFGPFDPDNARFDQEQLINYELGAKTDWMDSRLRINAAAFYQDFKDKQVSSQAPSTSNPNLLTARVVNAGKAEVWGAELELAWAATDNLSMNLSYTWLDTEYTDYQSVAGGVGQIAYVGNCVAVVPTGGPAAFPPGALATACVVDYSGNELEGAPENALVGGARYQAGLVGSTDWFVDGDFQFQDDRFTSDQNTLVFPSYWMFNFRTGIVNDSWDVIAYVDNAFDDDTIKTGFADGDIPTFANTFRFLNHATVILPDPRTYGLRVNYRFGQYKGDK